LQNGREVSLTSEGITQDQKNDHHYMIQGLERNLEACGGKSKLEGMKDWLYAPILIVF